MFKLFKFLIISSIKLKIKTENRLQDFIDNTFDRG